MSYLDDFRMNVKYYREQRRISQLDLAMLCDCGNGTIGGIESGKGKAVFIVPPDKILLDSVENNLYLPNQVDTNLIQPFSEVKFFSHFFLW